jgi:hypothetical protein
MHMPPNNHRDDNYYANQHKKTDFWHIILLIAIPLTMLGSIFLLTR